VEVDVKAHVRRIRRTRYVRTCACPDLPVILTAPGPPKLLPKGTYGVSVWVHLVLEKCLHYRPLTRLVGSLSLLGVELSPGTLTGGLKRFAPLLDPVYQAIIHRNQQETHWHADETRWLVFEEVQGKVGSRWYLGVFHSVSPVVYLLDPSRSATVPKAHLQDAQEGILSVDRYQAYKTFVNAREGAFRLAFCWAPVRRDFLRLASTRSDQEPWAMSWVERLGTLYHLNHQRVAAQDDPIQCAELDTRVREAIGKMERQRDQELDDEHLLLVRRRLLTSLKEHWEGLLLFVDHPEIPMDNNAAERALRGPVVGRKNCYGSGAQWSGELAAMLFTAFQTLLLWQLNPKTWLARFFQVCAEQGGQPVADVARFLPWNMTPDDLDAYGRAPPPPSASSS
jgi:transposase